MFKHLIFLIVLFIIYPSLFAQEEIEVYYNENWEITDSTKYTYYRIGVIDPNTLKWNGFVRDFYKNDSLCMEAYYNQSKKNGEVTFYFSNGNINRTGLYDHSSRIGEWTYYYEDGSLWQRVVFSKVDPYDIITYNFSVLEYYTQDGTQKIKDGNGKWEYTYTEEYKYSDGFGGKEWVEEDYRISGSFKNGKKHHIWKSYRSVQTNLNWEEWFKDGVYRPTYAVGYVRSQEMMNKFPDDKLRKFRNTEEFKLDTTVYDPAILYGDTESILSLITGKPLKIKSREAGYPDGDYALYEFIGNNIKYPAHLRNKGVEGTVYLKISIDEQGRTHKIDAMNDVQEDFVKEAIRIISLIDHWIPALQGGQAVVSSITIPIRFEIN